MQNMAKYISAAVMAMILGLPVVAAARSSVHTMTDQTTPPAQGAMHTAENSAMESGSMWEKTKGSICVFCRAQWYSKFPVKNHKKVSMHPIESINENIDKNNKSQNTLTDKDINKEEKKDIINKDEDNKKIKKERRHRSRSRNRSRSKKEHLNINRKSKSY